ncbi:MAG TPA: DUF427 domain-containing protein [Caulobacteraceae bacterium]|jgi:uncharacterized protein (DUF427 family)|nr:DUF427 domain-containing protein [Caulobacteraceae bacterium]
MSPLTPENPIHLRAAPQRMQASYMGHVIADSDDVIMLDELGHEPVAYFPRGDVDMAYMVRTDHHTHCPRKGEASYYTLSMDGRLGENAVWTYERPFDHVEAIRDRLAFYPVVEVRAVEDEERSRVRTDVDEVVRHTDAGAGEAQADAWAPTVDEPPL